MISNYQIGEILGLNDKIERCNERLKYLEKEQLHHKNELNRIEKEIEKEHEILHHTHEEFSRYELIKK